ncbi:MAG: PaaI family thioesterase [Burkholderiales bacterium]
MAATKKPASKSSLASSRARATLPPNTLPQSNRAMIEQSLAVGMGYALGIRLKKLSRRRLEAEMTVTDSHINRSGRINGGVLMAFADVLGAMGTLANLPEGCRTTTLESKTNFFAAGEGAVLAATVVPLHIGRTTMVWQTTIRNLDRTRVAIVTQTQIVIPRKS